MVMIELVNLCKKFGKIDALSQISLSLKNKVITAVVGPNGSGKTTLIKCILGLVSPSMGSIVIDSFNLDGSAEYRKLIGYMPQLPRFPDNLQLGEVILLVKSLRKSTVSQDEELVSLFGIKDDLHKRVRTLSGGTKQKLNAVIALMFNPGILILDEPTAGLDPVASISLKEKIRELSQNGTTVILTSHIISEIEDLSEEIIFLHEGAVLFQGTKTDLKGKVQSQNLEEAVARFMKNGYS